MRPIQTRQRFCIGTNQTGRRQTPYTKENYAAGVHNMVTVRHDHTCTELLVS